MSHVQGVRCLPVGGQLTGSVLLLGTQSSLALQDDTARILAAQSGVQGCGRPGRVAPSARRAASAFLLSAQWELLVLLYRGKLRRLVPQKCLLLLVPEAPERPWPQVCMAWGGERGNRLGEHLLFLNKGTHFFRQMSRREKDTAGDQQRLIRKEMSGQQRWARGEAGPGARPARVGSGQGRS